MGSKVLIFRNIIAITLCLWVSLPAIVLAAVIDVPGPADINRIKPEERLPNLNTENENQQLSPTNTPIMPVPEGADKIKFTLKDVKIVGNTAFSDAGLADIYSAFIGKEITLAAAYHMAEIITERYRDAGYFLSLAYIPPQEINSGTITIKVVEGHIGQVEIGKSAYSYFVIRSYIEDLQKKIPLKSSEMESFLLRLNDLPGYSVSGVIAPIENADEGLVKLSLVSATKNGQGQISFDNFSSRFLGPNEVGASYAASLVPLQQTTISALTSTPAERLGYGMIGHSVAFAPDFTLDFSGSYIKAKPGYTLERFDIDSESYFFSLGVNYQAIRQRDENLVFKFAFDSRNTSSDLLTDPLTRDKVRALRANASYDVIDAWYGYNIAKFTLSQGIDGLGASEKNYLYLSRAEGQPDFTKAEISLTRLQGITKDWMLLASAEGQKASGPLYSAEEFGYGGQNFGRAYDISEIVGDNGISGSLELQYKAVSQIEPIGLTPYIFYDIGKVWNYDAGQVEQESGSSAGLGVKLLTNIGLTGNFGLAFPLTRDVQTPIYGSGKQNPRLMLQISQQF